MKNTLAAYGAQSAFPFAVVVDNHSTDGTAEILRRVGLCDKDFFIYYDLIKEIVYLIHIVFKYHIAYLEPFIILTIIILL